MKRVLIESPFAAPTPEQHAEHIRYARACLKDSLQKNEAPLASHLLYTQPGVLDDTIPHERQWGIDAGVEWYKVAEACIVYTDCGISKGMQYGIAKAKELGISVEYRTVPGWTPKIKPSAPKKDWPRP
jgi:hypothetical protein